VPYFWAGLKAYDLVAGTRNLVLSKYVSPTESIQRFPSLATTHTDGASLKGTVRARQRHPASYAGRVNSLHAWRQHHPSVQ
jgi:hypothetical protein